MLGDLAFNVVLMRSSDASAVPWIIPADLTIFCIAASGACALSAIPGSSQYPSAKSLTDNRNFKAFMPVAGVYPVAIDIAQADIQYLYGIFAAAVQTDIAVYFQLTPATGN
jgi:hypothetical protein